MSDRSGDMGEERVEENGAETVTDPRQGGSETARTGTPSWPPSEQDRPVASTWPGATAMGDRWGTQNDFSLTRSAPPGPASPTSGPGVTRGRGWLLVALVAALVGGGVSAGVSALMDNKNSPTTIAIKEGSAAPGAAIDNGVSIPTLVDKVLPAVVSIDVKTPLEEDQGTGMIISPDGLVVTNYHVVGLAAEAAGALTVTESGSTTAIKATLVGTDPTNDMALLRINGASNLKTIIFGNSDKAVVGDAVVTIGNALGLSQGSPTVTQGIVSAIGRTVTASASPTSTETLSGLIQTDAAINPGNSGGPLIDTAGEVIGMNTAVAGTTADGTSAQNIGFAIPSAQIESLLPTLEKGGTKTTAPGYLGVFVTTLTPQLRSQYGLTPTSGALITGIVQGGPAAQAGLAQGDVIVGIGSKDVASQSDLLLAIQGDQAGQKVKVIYYRGPQKRATTVTLVSQSEIQTLQGQGLGFGGGATTP